MTNQALPRVDPETKIERSFVGGTIVDEHRPKAMRLSNIRVLWEDIADPFARKVYRASELADSEKWEHATPTPDVIAHIIMIDPELEGSKVYGSDDDYRAAQVQWVKVARDMSGMGPTDQQIMSSMGSILMDIIEARHQKRTANRIVEFANDTALTAMDRYSAMAAEVEKSRPKRIEMRVFDSNDIARLANTMARKRQDMIGKMLPAFPSHWGLDRLIPNLLAGFVYVISGLTGRGKTALLMEAALFLVECGFKVAFFHLEDTPEKQIDRLTRHLADAPQEALRSGDLEGQYYMKMAQRIKSAEKRTGGKLWLAHCPGTTTTSISTVTEQLGADIIFIDYFQKVEYKGYIGQSGNVVDAKERVMEDIKQISENPKHPCVVVLGSQEAEYQNLTERKGTAGSRSIEHKGQAVIEFQRLKTNDPIIVDGVTLAKEGQHSPFSSIIVHKFNDGETGRVHGIFDGRRYKFTGMEYRRWKDKHPDREYPLPVLQAPDEATIQRHFDWLKAIDRLHLYQDHPSEKQPGAGSTKSTSNGGHSKGHIENWGSKDGNINGDGGGDDIPAIPF